MSETKSKTEITFEDFKQEVLNDYKIASISRECSLLGRKEVLTGKAKFGIFGDGKEVPQLAMAKAFQKPKHSTSLPSNWRHVLSRQRLHLLLIQLLFTGHSPKTVLCGRVDSLI